MTAARNGLPRDVRCAGDPPLRPAAVARLGGIEVAEMQRSRLLAAAVAVVDEWGYDGTSVARITERARVSRRTFYELFENREDCLLAVLDSGVDQIATEIAGANLEGLPWRERVRRGLWVILCFFDREPGFARMCIVESQRAGKRTLEARQRMLELLADIVEEGRGESSRSSYDAALIAHGLVGGIFSILHTRLLDPRREPLSDLLSELMGMIVLPYLGSGAARREQSRPAPAPVSDAAPVTTFVAVGALAALPMRLTYRTATVLRDLAEHPGSSNREVSERVGVTDQGQMSKLLARLARLCLLENTASGAHDKGEPNEWRLTDAGQQVAGSIRAHAGDTRNTHDKRAA
jgi:AcrR family transcriptional regulator